MNQLAKSSIMLSPYKSSARWLWIAPTVFLILILAIPTTAIIFWSPPKIGTGVFGILILSELVVGVISAALLTDEAFGWPQILGTAMILSAGILEVVANTRLNRLAPLAPACLHAC